MDSSGIWMVQSSPIAEWSGIWMASEYWTVFNWMVTWIPNCYSDYHSVNTNYRAAARYNKICWTNGSINRMIPTSDFLDSFYWSKFLTIPINFRSAGDTLDDNGHLENGNVNGNASSSDSSDNEENSKSQDAATSQNAATTNGEKSKKGSKKGKKKRKTKKKSKKTVLMRRNIRNLMTDENLTETTKEARVRDCFTLYFVTLYFNFNWTKCYLD